VRPPGHSKVHRQLPDKTREALHTHPRYPQQDWWIGFKGSRNLASVRRKCGHIGVVITRQMDSRSSVLQSPLYRSSCDEETGEVVKMCPVPVCLLPRKDVSKSVRDISMSFAPCLNDAGSGTGSGTNVNVSVFTARFDLVRHYLPVCCNLRVKLSTQTIHRASPSTIILIRLRTFTPYSHLSYL
jgi:hypothetical protein